MEREIVRGAQGRVEKIIYRCQNLPTCDYQVESDIRLSGMCMPNTVANAAK